MPEILQNIIDKHLFEMISSELNVLPERIEPEMSDQKIPATNGWNKWLPIESKVSELNLKNLEKIIGYSLPDLFKTFLKHKHFYELYIGDVSFCRHPVNLWQKELTDKIFRGYPKEYLIDKGLIPFADYSDWGLVCFNTSEKLQNSEYKIVRWDHELPNQFLPLYDNFTEMIIALDKQEKNAS